jgi:hypothetical protein
MVSINCFIDRASRSSFHTMSVSPLRANSSASCFGQCVPLQGKVLVYGRNVGGSRSASVSTFSPASDDRARTTIEAD